jgi:hypothetical protein
LGPQGDKLDIMLHHREDNERQTSSVSYGSDDHFAVQSQQVIFQMPGPSPLGLRRCGQEARAWPQLPGRGRPSSGSPLAWRCQAAPALPHHPPRKIWHPCNVLGASARKNPASVAFRVCHRLADLGTLALFTKGEEPTASLQARFLVKEVRGGPTRKSADLVDNHIICPRGHSCRRGRLRHNGLRRQTS